ncbi:MAG: DNA replication and repair protein RecF [Candidatus Latescibacterota bacterium]|nr:DNA replication and repair protein RecF [Candidatus Latescibacterota bacterium]
MQLRELSLRPFRNFEKKHLCFSSARTLIYAENGKGKSNILEAISYLSIGKSIRGVKDNHAIPHTGSHFDVRGVFFRDGAKRNIRVFFGKQEGKRVFLEEEPLLKVSDLVGEFRTVHFSPEEVSLVLRFPTQRRRLLDILISQARPTYLKELQKYRRALSQRNKMLRNSKNGFISSEFSREIAPWDKQIAEFGASIRFGRLNAIESMRADFVGFYNRFSPEGEYASLNYNGPKTKEIDSLTKELFEEITKKRQQELRAGYTIVGPHRDDVLFEINGKTADDFASEGQLKTALISWKLAESRFIEKQCSQQPILLLDDIFSELDSNRMNLLLDSITEFDQVITTTPRELGLEGLNAFEKICFGQ